MAERERAHDAQMAQMRRALDVETSQRRELEKQLACKTEAEEKRLERKKADAEREEQASVLGEHILDELLAKAGVNAKGASLRDADPPICGRPDEPHPGAPPPTAVAANGSPKPAADHPAFNALVLPTHMAHLADAPLHVSLRSTASSAPVPMHNSSFHSSLTMTAEPPTQPHPTLTLPHRSHWQHGRAPNTAPHYADDAMHTLTPDEYGGLPPLATEAVPTLQERRIADEALVSAGLLPITGVAASSKGGSKVGGCAGGKAAGGKVVTGKAVVVGRGVSKPASAASGVSKSAGSKAGPARVTSAGSGKPAGSSAVVVPPQQQQELLDCARGVRASPTPHDLAQSSMISLDLA